MRRLLILLLLLASAPASAEVEVKYTQFTLPNGLNVILHEDHRVPMVAVNIWYFVGSANERPGRTGFAHLFEHLLFEGSGHVKEGEFDTLLEAAGGSNNGSTDTDRTNYYETLPVNSLEVALFLESDRMGYLLDSMPPSVVDGQREVVKNERRQSYENRPYGMAQIRLQELLYPENHPYHWPTIGYMPDLNAASYEDVVAFYKKYYAPNNASLVIAGDINPVETRRLVEKWFQDVPRGQPVEKVEAPPAQLSGLTTEVLRDKVQLPRLYLAWLTPAHLAPGDAEMDVVADILTGGKNSRLYRRLVYEMQVAQEVSASQVSGELGSHFVIEVTARPGTSLDELKTLIDEEIELLRNSPPAERELQRTVNGIEAGFYSQLERLEAKANRLNSYYKSTGNPDFFSQDLARYQVVSPEQVQATVRRYLPADRRLELSVLPEVTP